MLAFPCFLIHYYRKDTPFIYKHLSNSHLQILSEYVALTLPFAISCIVTKSWYCLPLLLLLLFFIPFFKHTFRNKTVFKNLSVIIAAAHFEWLSGYRKNYIFITGIYLLALALSWFKIFPLILLWMLTTLISIFFSECESIQVLRETDKPAAGFLYSKIKIAIIYIVILYTPVIIINFIFNPDYLLLILLFLPMQISIVCFSIFFKYSSYEPNLKHEGNNFILSLIAFAGVIPYLLPVPAILSIVYFYKAEKNLKKYLND